MNDDRIFYLFCACFALMIMSVMHVVQQKKINDIQLQVDELKIIVDQKFLPSLILDTKNLMVR